jgi:hypothetical protein
VLIDRPAALARLTGMQRRGTTVLVGAIIVTLLAIGVMRAWPERPRLSSVMISSFVEAATWKLAPISVGFVAGLPSSAIVPDLAEIRRVS